ncbi:MAG: hypothetical protein ACKPKO_09040, partial [Candidatus Fonsibacter sp.]
MDELTEQDLKAFTYGENPLNSYHKEDNLKSAKFIERSQTVQKLIKSLGFADVNDERKVDKDT